MMKNLPQSVRRTPPKWTEPISASDGFLTRLAKCMDVSVRELADIGGVTQKELKVAMNEPRRGLVPYYLDPMYDRIRKHIDERIGALIAARRDLEAKCADDDKRRLARRLQETGEL
jgi:hypothetical protein